MECQISQNVYLSRKKHLSQDNSEKMGLHLQPHFNVMSAGGKNVAKINSITIKLFKQFYEFDEHNNRNQILPVVMFVEFLKLL